MDNVNASLRSTDPLRGGDGAPRVSPLQTVWHRRWIVAGTVAISMATGAVLAKIMPKVYTRTCQIVVEPAAGKTSGDNSMVTESYLNTQVELITKSAAIHADAVNSLMDGGAAHLHDFLTTPDRLALLRQNISATTGKNDNVITVAYSSRYPDEAARAVMAVVDAYSSFTSSDNHKSNGDSIKSLEDDMEKREREMHEKHSKLAVLKGDISKLETDKTVGNSDLESLKTLTEALAASQLESINAQASFEEFAKLNVGDPAKLDAVLASNKFNGATDAEQVKADLYAAKQRLAYLKERYLPNHPAVQGAQTKVDDLTASEILYLHQKWVSASAKVKLLQANHDAQQKHVAETAESVTKDLASKTAEYDEIEKSLARTERMTDLLNTRMQDVSSADRIGTVRISVLSAPKPDDLVPPTKPNLTMMLFEGLMVGLILGTTIALVDPRVRSVEEVVAATNLPILGVIPRMKKSLSLQTRGRKVHLDPMSDVSEAYRAIRSAVFFGPKGKTILVTSPMRAEGKSTSAANLSIAMAEAGQRVLLIDGDLREPMQHRIFAVSNDAGVSSVVAGRGSVDRAIQSSGVRGLDLLPCGTIPFNPSETINNQAFADLLSDLAHRYDYVVVDSPPVMAVTDARILSAMCDLTLLVIRAEKSSKRAAHDARDGLMGFGANVVGVIINDGPRNRQRYGYYGGYGRPGAQPVANFVRSTGTAERSSMMGTDFMYSKR